MQTDNLLPEIAEKPIPAEPSVQKRKVPKRMIHAKERSEAFPKDMADVEALKAIGFIDAAEEK